MGATPVPPPAGSGPAFARLARILVGLALAAAAVGALTSQATPGAIAQVLGQMSGGGLAAVCGLQVASILLCGVAWKILAPESSVLACTLARWIRDGASSIFGIVPGAGEVAGARALKLLGARSSDAAASTVVDVVTESLSQLVFTLCGVAVILGPMSGDGVLVQSLEILAAALPPALAIFLLSRSRTALSWLERLLNALGRVIGLGAAAARLDLPANVSRIYERRLQVGAAAAIHLAAWFLGAAQVWAAASAMGRPLAFSAALALVSLGYAARGALFMVPMGAGVQEMTFLLAGRYVGVDEAGAVALSLVLRVRDVALGAPAVMTWGVAELLSARTRARAAAPTPE